jgi:hypothetical protein
MLKPPTSNNRGVTTTRDLGQVLRNQSRFGPSRGPTRAELEESARRAAKKAAKKAAKTAKKKARKAVREALQKSAGYPAWNVDPQLSRIHNLRDQLAKSTDPSEKMSLGAQLTLERLKRAHLQGKI